MLEKPNGRASNNEPQPHTASTKPKPVQHRWFDPWLIARSEPLKQLVREIGQDVGSREQRGRSRRLDDERNHHRVGPWISALREGRSLQSPIVSGRFIRLPSSPRASPFQLFRTSFLPSGGSGF